jgi:hypothetical protein
LDTFSFGWESEDGTVCSLGYLSSMTPVGWYTDESIHNKTTPDSLMDSVTNKTKALTPISGNVKKTRKRGQSLVDISVMAEEAWKHRFGNNLLISFKTFSHCGRTMHTAHCNGIYHDIQDNNTSKWIFPKYAEDEHHKSMCFPKIKMANRAFLWHVLMHVATLEWRQQWLGSMIDMDGLNGSTVLIETRGSNSIIQLVLRGHTFVFKEMGGNEEWACCRKEV